MRITDDIRYVGVNDYDIDLFEGIYKVPNGVSYNSYVILDEKIAVLDTVDGEYEEQWLHNIERVLEHRKPDYLIVQHMEPDHSANILNFMEKYPATTLVASAKAFVMMTNFFGRDFIKNGMVVDDEGVLSLGKHKLMFFTAPMVHWPEVIMTYDSMEKVLFSADGFGKFGAYDVQEEWIDEARRYYIGIVGKYGVYVQKLLKKVAGWDIQKICPLHGPVLTGNIEYYIELYNTWSTYTPEEEGIMIAYTSVYGNTRNAVMLLQEKLKERGYKRVIIYDLARCDMSVAVAEAFKYSKLVLATTTYNAEIFPPMRQFVDCLTERHYQKRLVGIIENGSWAPIAAKIIKEKLERCKGIIFIDTTVRILSVPNEESIEQLDMLAEELCRSK